MFYYSYFTALIETIFPSSHLKIKSKPFHTACRPCLILLFSFSNRLPLTFSLYQTSLLSVVKHSKQFLCSGSLSTFCFLSLLTLWFLFAWMVLMHSSCFSFSIIFDQLSVSCAQRLWLFCSPLYVLYLIQCLVQIRYPVSICEMITYKNG